LRFAELIGDSTPLAGFHVNDVASGLVPDGAAFVRRKVGRYIEPRGRPRRLTHEIATGFALAMTTERIARLREPE
jgi:hypothetical protein